jgi:hypothetical protein
LDRVERGEEIVITRHGLGRCPGMAAVERTGIRPVSLVLGGSATLAWVYSAETTAAIRHVFDLIVNDGAWVPSLWRLEAANILEMGVRKGRHNSAFRDATLADLALLPVRLDPETDSRHGVPLFVWPPGAG